MRFSHLSHEIEPHQRFVNLDAFPYPISTPIVFDRIGLDASGNFNHGFSYSLMPRSDLLHSFATHRDLHKRPLAPSVLPGYQIQQYCPVGSPKPDRLGSQYLSDGQSQLDFRLNRKEKRPAIED
jgi:hypothetical protein